MRVNYDPNLQADLLVGADSRVRHIRHGGQQSPARDGGPAPSPEEYLRSVAATLDIPQSQLQDLSAPVSSLDPGQQGTEYHVTETKRTLDGVTVGYSQTYFNVPVWRKGISVTTKDNVTTANAARVVGCANNTEYGLSGELPDSGVISRYRSMLGAAPGDGQDAAAPSEDGDSLAGVVSTAIGTAAQDAGANTVEILNGRFVVYRFDPETRYAGKSSPPAQGADRADNELETAGPTWLNLSPVPAEITPGQGYLAAEIIFSMSGPDTAAVVWLILVEVASGVALYAEPMTQGVNALVFRRDPMVETGDLTVTANLPSAVLNTHRDDVLLTNLAPPVGGIQTLTGEFVQIQEREAPVVAPPTKPAGIDFDFDARTNNFAAANAYYHQTELFRTIESLGFDIATYFDGTTFPIPVDHRGMGSDINAHWAPNGVGGTGHMCYALGDLTDTTNPLGRAVDPWVHWHEMGGHGTLGDHVNSGVLGFAHSAGDGLAAIQMDPESALRGVPERFKYAPFRPNMDRRFDRPVTSWAWNGGPNDDNNYGSEQILATCHFRLYRSIGGDHSSVARRRFASRVATYLILRTIASLTPATNPTTPELWCEAMISADQLDWTSEGLAGGVYGKVVRWAFEKQGAFQPVGAPTPVTTVGAPPEQDVYIDDGRGGEYEFQQQHWQNTSMWNRNNADGLPGHQDAVEGQPNFMYVKVKNRGTLTANDVNVRGYHCLPGAGLTWPADFTEMTPTGGLSVASIGANSTEEVIVGPFEWTPNVNAFGHDCVLMIASAPGDPSNVDNLAAGETVEEWRLVPNDNNIGQRNVVLVPGGGGEAGLMRGLDQHVFVAANSLRRDARMELTVEMPEVLQAADWKLQFKGMPENTFELAAGERREITIELVPGRSFSAEQVRASRQRDITVALHADGMLLGGMTYRLDPDKIKPGASPNPDPRPGR